MEKLGKALKAVKLSRTSCIFLSVGIFVVIAGSLGLTRSQQLQEQTRLEEELAVAEMMIKKLKVQELQQKQQELEKNLEESTIELEEAKDNLRQPVASIAVTDEFFRIARDCGVTVANFSSSGVKDEKKGDISCSKISMSAAVTGNVPDIIEFVTMLNNDFTTGVVDTVQVNIKAGSGGISQANISMAVLAYEGE